MKRLRRHANVQSLIGVITNSQPFCVVSEYSNGGPLDTWLRTNARDVDATLAAAFIVAAVRGVRHLHKLSF